MPISAPAKFVTVHGFLGKTEASYGAGGSLSTATDGILPDEMAKFEVKYANDGKRPAPAGTLGYQRKVPPSGKYVEALPLKHAPKLPGAAYAAGVFGSFHNPLRWGGMDAAGSFTGGTEKWTYTPTPGPTGYASGVGSAYDWGELWPLTGLLADWTWGFKGPEVPVFDFTLRGLVGTYSDALPPTITYPYDARDAVKAVGVTCSLFGSFVQTAVREATIKFGRTFQPRVDVTAAGGHLGWAPVRRTPTLELLIEAPPSSTEDLWAQYEAGTGGAWALNVGSAQYDRFKWSGASGQITDPPKHEDDGAVALLRLIMQLNPSSLTANDDLQLVTD